MLRYQIVLLSILPLLAFMTACKGEPASTPGNASTAGSPRPASATNAPPPTPTSVPATSTPIPEGNNSTGAAESPTTIAPAAPLQVKSTESVANPTLPPATPESATPTPLVENPQDVATIKQMIKEYWEALNDYDVDRAILMLEKSYRAAEEELIRGDIGRMKLFRVKLGMSEETPLALNDDGDYETYLNAKTPIDTRRVFMVFRKIDRQWWIVFSGEVE